MTIHSARLGALVAAKNERALVSAGLFWLHCGDTDTVYGLYNVSSLLFFLMMFASAKVSCSQTA